MSQHHSKGIREYIFQVPGNPLPWSLLLFTIEVFSLHIAYFQINLLSYQRESGFGFFSLSLPSFILCLYQHLLWRREKLSSFASSGSSQATTPQPTGITFPSSLLLDLDPLARLILPRRMLFQKLPMLPSGIPAEDEQGQNGAVTVLHRAEWSSVL